MKPTDPEADRAPDSDEGQEIFREPDDMYDPDLAYAHDVGMPPFGVAL